MQMTELFPEYKNPKVGYKVFTILAEVIQDKTALGLPAKWKRNYELGKNKHWAMPSNKITLMTANLLYTHRQRTVNMLTDNDPVFNIVKRGNPQEVEGDTYDNLSRIAEFWWGDTEQQTVLRKSVQNGETYGCTIEKVSFNPEKEYNLGEVEAEVIDPFHFGFYPVKSDDIQKADANFHYWPMSVREARRRWPEFKDDITSDDEFLKELGDTRREVTANAKGQPKGYFSTFSGVVKNMLNSSSEGKAEGEELLICECWCKDYSKDEEGNDLYKGNIRVITVCNGGKIVLEDRSNPSISSQLEDEEAQKTYLYDKFPFTLTVSIADNSMPWGESDFQHLEPLQIEINKTMTQFTMFKDKVAGFKFINPKTSGVSNSEITNRTGILNPSNDIAAQGLKYIDPPKMPSDLMAAVNFYKEMFFLISGSFELEAAQTPGKEVIAYKAIAALIEHASNMLKGKQENYSKMVRERGRMFLSHVMNFYTEDRWIPSEEGDEQIAINGSKMRVPAKLTIVSGSMMLRSKVVEREEALALFDKGAIDDQELLKKLGWTAAAVNELIKRKQAGPFGELFDKLSGIGVPPEILEAFNELAQLDMKDFENAIKKGEVPGFGQMIQNLEAPQANPMDELEIADKQADIGKKVAEQEKIATETQLAAEKINTEKVIQEVKLLGTTYDEKKLRMEEAKTINDIQATKDRSKRETAKLINDIKTSRIEKPKLASAITKSADSKVQGPYVEKGLKSNNEE